MRRTAPPPRPYGRYAVGLRPSLDPDAYFDAPSQDKEARGINQTTQRLGLDRPRSFRNDLRKLQRAAAGGHTQGSTAYPIWVCSPTANVRETSPDPHGEDIVSMNGA
jgi:hypothetical protein